jgi:hypothetical protein
MIFSFLLTTTAHIDSHHKIQGQWLILIYATKALGTGAQLILCTLLDMSFREELLSAAR